MNDTVERWLGIAAGLAVGLGLLWYLYGPRLQEQLREPEAPAAQAPSPKVPGVEDAPLYPVPEPPLEASGIAPTQPEVPDDLAATDATVRQELARIFGAQPVEAHLIPERVVQNIVTTIDSLDREPVPMRYRAIGTVAEQPVVDRSGDTLHLGADNAARYAHLVGVLERADARRIAAIYLRLYPLFQRAYRDLGYPQGHFNDRVVAIIDHLLATPVVAGPIALVRPKVLYEFADPQLEALSSGQKLLIRIGPENAAVVKERLREIRVILAARATRDAPPAGPGPPRQD